MYRLVFYTVGTTIVAAVAFVAMNATLSTHDLPAPGLVATTFIATMAVMFCAGVLGGCLYNVRGLIKHSQRGDFDQRFTLSYYLRPLSAGVSGLMVFFLLMGGALTLNVGNVGQAAWQSLVGRMPYVALSLLAGYGSQEFMMKLKDLAETLFALRNKSEAGGQGGLDEK